jgi:hypothetical protein
VGVVGTAAAGVVWDIEGEDVMSGCVVVAGAAPVSVTVSLMVWLRNYFIFTTNFRLYEHNNITIHRICT